MKEFRLTLTLPLPEDKFAEAKLVTELEKPLTAFLEALRDVANGGVVEHEIVTPRKKADEANGAGFGRKPKALAAE